MSRGTVTGDLTASGSGTRRAHLLGAPPTFGINLLCHLFGKPDYDRAGEPCNLARDPHLGRGGAQHFQAFPISIGAADGPQVDLSAQLIG